MSNDLDKFRIRELVKIAVLKHRGDVLAIAKEVNLPMDLTLQYIKKVKKTEDDVTATKIARNLTEHIIRGHQSRTIFLYEMLDSLHKREQVYWSKCCKAPAREEKQLDKTIYICCDCGKECQARLIDREKIYEIKSSIIAALKSEDESLVSMLKEMGYTYQPVQPDPVSPITVKQNVVVFDSHGQQVAKEIGVLDPVASERLLKRLEYEILDIAQKSADEEKERRGEKSHDSKGTDGSQPVSDLRKADSSGEHDAG